MMIKSNVFVRQPLRQTRLLPFLITLIALGFGVQSRAQVNSGSDGHDGAFNPTTNVVIDMADHPSGIYHYTTINIPEGVTVSFRPNVNNTPIVWLAQSNVVISGMVHLLGQSAIAATNYLGWLVGGAGGPGGYHGGPWGGPGSGPGADQVGGGGASYATTGFGQAGPLYGNEWLIPLLGGSGGGNSGGGGGGAILIVSPTHIHLSGLIAALGGAGCNGGGGGSGGAVRLVSPTISGVGCIDVSTSWDDSTGGQGRIRFDTYVNSFSGVTLGNYTQGAQFIIIPSVEQGVPLSIESVAGTLVSGSPQGLLASPDTVISGLQTNPVPIVVRCAGIPLNTPITVTVTPVKNAPVSAIGTNNSGTLASSTATVFITMPRGGGFINATVATGN